MVGLIVTSFSFVGDDETLSKKNRKFASKYLKETREELFEKIKNLSTEQWNYKLDENTWSVSEACEHIWLAEKSVLQNEIASVGMFVLESQRQKGVGTATLRLLQDHCAQHDIIPIAGCWYYNHNSKKTLEKAGFYAASRLLRIDY